jgi:hypothetical protein
MSKVIIKATNLGEYGKGWQINAFVDGIESEATYYGYSKKDAIAKAEKVIQQEGKLNCEAYKGEYAIFSEAQRQKVLVQFAKVA